MTTRRWVTSVLVLGVAVGGAVYGFGLLDREKDPEQAAAADCGAVSTSPSTTVPFGIEAVPAGGPTVKEAPAALSVVALPAAVVLDGVGVQLLLLAVTNTGSQPIANLQIEVRPPPTISVTSPPNTIAALVGGQTQLQTVKLKGRLNVAGTTTIVAQGISDNAVVFASTSVEHPAPAPLATLAVAGPGKLTNSRDLSLLATVKNSSDYALEVGLTAVTSDSSERIAPPALGCETLHLAAGDSRTFTVTLSGDELPTADEVLTMTARLKVQDQQASLDEIAVTHPFSTEPFGDSTFLGPLSLESLLLLPGFLAVLLACGLRAIPRARRGVHKGWLPDFKQVPMALAVIGLSAVAIVVYGHVTGEPLFKGYSARTLGQVTVATLLATAAVVGTRVLWIEHRYPIFDHKTTALDVLDSLRQFAGPTVSIDGRIRIVVWTFDGGACISPRLQIIPSLTSDANAIKRAVDRGDLEALRRQAQANGVVVRFWPRGEDVWSHPVTGELTADAKETTSISAVQYAETPREDPEMPTDAPVGEAL